MHSYLIAGLTVESELLIPAVVPVSLAGTPDVTIRRGTVPSHLTNPTAAGATWQLTESDFLLFIPGLVRFLIVDGETITFETEQNVQAEEIAAFIPGTVLGVLLHQRGRILFHASAVAVGNKAVLFCGPTGAGKSTLAAALNRHGNAIVTDDLAALTIDDDVGPVVHVDGRMIKLWTEAITQLDLVDQRGGRVRSNLQKFYVTMNAEPLTKLRVGAVYILQEARPPMSEGIQMPNFADACSLLRRNAYRPGLLRRLGQREIYYRAGTALVGAGGVFQLTRPLDFARLPDTIEMLKVHWKQLGLTNPEGGAH